MRVLYFVIGLLLSVLVVTEVENHRFDRFQEDIGEALKYEMLNAYQDGYVDGRDNTALKMRWITMDALQELEMCYKRGK